MAASCIRLPAAFPVAGVRPDDARAGAAPACLLLPAPAERGATDGGMVADRDADARGVEGREAAERTCGAAGRAGWLRGAAGRRVLTGQVCSPQPPHGL
ncbi:MAG: hypothetical protein LBB54_01305 [Cellulomonadaceae bacterium]|nr:hypothetical protein [Cellulomonadaceae bacterium]